MAYLQGCWRGIQCISLLGAYTGHCGIRKHAPVQKLHNIERSPDNPGIFAQAISLWYRHICLFQSMDNLVFALYLVCCLGKELTRWLLSKDIPLLIGRNKLVSRVRLAKTELYAISMH